MRLSALSSFFMRGSTIYTLIHTQTHLVFPLDTLGSTLDCTMHSLGNNQLGLFILLLGIRLGHQFHNAFGLCSLGQNPTKPAVLMILKRVFDPGIASKLKKGSRVHFFGGVVKVMGETDEARLKNGLVPFRINLTVKVVWNQSRHFFVIMIG
jgi:hypothetical protein